MFKKNKDFKEQIQQQEDQYKKEQEKKEDIYFEDLLEQEVILEQNNEKDKLEKYYKIDLKENVQINNENLLNILNQQFQKPHINYKKQLRPIEREQCDAVKKLLYGSEPNKKLPDSWRQGLILNDKEDLFFGLVQNDGGPCGIIGVVQAYMLKYILIHQDLKEFHLKSKQEQEQIRWNSVLMAISDILFQQNEESVVLVVESQDYIDLNQQIIRIDQCVHKRIRVQKIEDIFRQLQEFRDDFKGNNGMVLIMYSVILSKGVEQIKEEMDDPCITLIGQHSHCVQELVNLLLTGCASSNCFDHNKEIDQGYLLKGIQQQSQIGFLSIFEYYKYIQIGNFFKSPKYPIWLICKEHHYSVVFSQYYFIIHNPVQHFDLVFYDQLHAKNELIKLTFNSNISNQDQNNDIDLVPPLNLLLTTKFNSMQYHIDWNDAVPML